MESESATPYPGSELTALQLIHALDLKLNEEASYSPSIHAAAERNESVEFKVKSLRVQAGIRFRQNAFHSTIHRLNPECMAIIFRFVSNECHAKICGAWTQPYDWIAISRVCRSWRSTSLQFPSTWSIFDSSSPTLAQICLERSKTSPLDVRIRSGCSEELFQALLPHTSRFRDFHSTLTSWEHIGMFKHFKGVPAPLLRSLDFDIPDTAGFPRMIAPDSPFAAPLPLLTCLSLAHFPIGQWVSHFTDLTSLTLRDNHVDASPSLTTFLDFLQLSPRLERIQIASTTPFDDESDPKRIVTLKHLKTLTLTRCGAKVILSHLGVPHGAHLRLVDIEVDGSEGAIPSTFPVSYVHLQPLYGMKTLLFSHKSVHQLLIHGGGPNGSLDLDVKNVNEASKSLILTSFPPFPMYHLRELSDLWLEIFGLHFGKAQQPSRGVIIMFTSKSLKTLTLLKCPCAPYLVALTPNLDGSIPVPSLTSLTIFDDHRLSTSQLLELAKARKASGVPLKHIMIICHPDRMAPAKKILELRTYVDVVDYRLDDIGPRWTSQWTE